MIYPFPLPQRPHFAEYVCYEGMFLPHELDRINAAWKEEESDKATVAGSSGQDYDDTLRQSSVLFLRPDPQHEWIYQKLGMIAGQSNFERFGFDLLGFYQALQLAEYGPGDFFEWHMDFGAGPISHRKLSLTVQLSDPDSYEGGDLQFMINHKVTDAPRTRGTVIVFPSFVPHRVTPVTRGVRRSIVGWISGAPYR